MAIPADRRKEERLAVRATPRQAALIRQAAEAQGRTVTDFILETATERAERLLAERQHLTVTSTAWDEFVAAVEAPTEPVPALVDLFTDPDLRR
jgi:uncharacterized protein (DUF1778 family)